MRVSRFIWGTVFVVLLLGGFGVIPMLYELSYREWRVFIIGLGLGGIVGWIVTAHHYSGIEAQRKQREWELEQLKKPKKPADDEDDWQ